MVVNLPRADPPPRDNRYGYYRGGNSGTIGGLFGMQGQFYVGMSDSMSRIQIAIPGYPSMYHTMKTSAGSGGGFSYGGRGSRAYQKNLQSRTSARQQCCSWRSW